MKIYSVQLSSELDDYQSKFKMVLGDYFIGRHNWENVDKNTLPKDIPEVDEVGATSAPLLSASYFIGAKCKPYNDDFMMCKDENNGGTLEC